MYKRRGKGKKKNEQKKRWEREKVKEKSQEGSSTFKPPKSFALFPVGLHRIRATWNLRSTHSQVARFLFPKKTYNVDSPPISNRFANNMAVLVFCVQSTQKPNKGLDIKFEKLNAENTTPKNHGSASNLCCRYSHKVGRMTAMDKILQKKNQWLFIQQW